ncbi:MAG: hypothetical protein HGA45_44825, partial [Chloroflexales bacterium]|nr:hypothetical protein [Chloroflexales bacterium]
MADPAMDPVPPGDAWQRALTTRLASLRALPEPPSFGPVATDQFLARLAAEAPHPAPPASPPRPQRAVRWPTVGMRLAGVALALLLAVLGTGYAAAASLPGAPLYPLKRQAEELRVTFTPPDARDDVRRALLEARRDELSALVAQQAPAAQMAAGVAEYAAAVAAAQAAGDSPALRAQLRE